MKQKYRDPTHSQRDERWGDIDRKKQRGIIAIIREERRNLTKINQSLEITARKLFRTIRLVFFVWFGISVNSTKKNNQNKQKKINP